VKFDNKTLCRLQTIYYTLYKYIVINIYYECNAISLNTNLNFTTLVKLFVILYYRNKINNSNVALHIIPMSS